MDLNWYKIKSLFLYSPEGEYTLVKFGDHLNPDDVEKLLNPEGKLSGRNVVSKMVAGVQFNLYTTSEIHLDFYPENIQSLEQFNEIVAFWKMLSKELNTSVIVCHDCLEDYTLFRFSDDKIECDYKNGQALYSLFKTKSSELDESILFHAQSYDRFIEFTNWLKYYVENKGEELDAFESELLRLDYNADKAFDSFIHVLHKYDYKDRLDYLKIRSIVSQYAKEIRVDFIDEDLLELKKLNGSYEGVVYDVLQTCWVVLDESLVPSSEMCDHLEAQFKDLNSMMIQFENVSDYYTLENFEDFFSEQHREGYTGYKREALKNKNSSLIWVKALLVFSGLIVSYFVREYSATRSPTYYGPNNMSPQEFEYLKEGLKINIGDLQKDYEKTYEVNDSGKTVVKYKRINY